MRKKKTLGRQMRDQANAFFNETITHDLSCKQYKRDFKKFVQFCRDKGIRSLEEGKKSIQEYSDFLKGQGKYSASSIHTFLAPVCRFYGVNMRTIRKEKRLCCNYTKGRKERIDRYRTYSDINNPKWSEIVEFQRRCGLRRSELMRLCGGDYKDGDDFFVVVRCGKGGKRSEYYIKPEDVGFIKKYFEGKATNERIFDAKLFENDLNLHKLRARHAEDLYYYFLGRVINEKGFREKLEKMVIDKWNEGNIDKRTGKPKKFDMREITGTYYLRCGNRVKAAMLGKPLSYNKLCLKATSCMALGHYRCSISILYTVLYE